MARYRVRLWNSQSLCDIRNDYRATRTSAALLAQRHAYWALESLGLLDTQAAHNVRDAMRLWDDLLPPAGSRGVEIKGTPYSVTMSRIY